MENTIKNTNTNTNNVDIENKLNDALNILEETKNVGYNILQELDCQKEKINLMRKKTDNINNNITKSNSVLLNIKNREKICLIS